MYIKDGHPQMRISKQLITEGTLRLMGQYRFKDLTVTQICQEAQIARRTFYRNYEYTIDILEYYLDQMFETYLSEYYEPEQNIANKLKCYFDFFLQHREFLMCIGRNNLFYLLKQTHERYMTEFLCNLDIVPYAVTRLKINDYVSGFITSTICSNLAIWISRNFETSSDIMAEMTEVFLSGLKKD